MLPKQNRLKKKKSFDEVFKKGKILRAPDFFLKYLEKEAAEARIGFVVSKKVSKRAVQRNKAKRRLREAFRSPIKLLSQGIDVVVVANPSIKSRTLREIAEEVVSTLKKGQLIK